MTTHSLIDSRIQALAPVKFPPPTRNPRHLKILAALLGVCLLGLNIWAFVRLNSAKDSAIEAMQGAQACRQLASDIQNLRQRPAVVEEEQPSADGKGTSAVSSSLADELSRRLEKLATSAGVPQGGLVSITPEPPARVGDSPYMERPVTVLLKNLTLGQLLTFLSSASGGSGLRVRDLRLSTPPQDQSGYQEQWTAEATLSYLVYSPRPQGSQENP